MENNELKINTSEFVKSLTALNDKPELLLKEFAFIGRSNVGKSTLINSLLNRKNLAKTSSKPGKTQLINYFLINQEFYFVDLPGYGFANVPLEVKNKWEKFIEAYLSRSDELRCLFLLLDSRHVIKESDVAMIEWLEHREKIYRLVFTKTDKIKQKEFYKNIRVSEEKYQMSFRNLFIPFSAKTGAGKDLLLKEIKSFL